HMREVLPARRVARGQVRKGSAHMTACRVAGLFGLALAALWPGRALAETSSVIDPVEAPAPQRPPAAKEAAQADVAVQHERPRAGAEQRRRAAAEVRAQTADNQAAKLRAVEEARRAEAAARKAAAARAAAARIAKAKAA